MRVEIFNSETPMELQERVNKWLKEREDKIKPVSTAMSNGDGWYTYSILYMLIKSKEYFES